MSIGSFPVKKLIVEWTQLLKGRFEKVREWLHSFLTALEENGFTVYLKAPASFFCNTELEKKYILDVKARKYIVGMSGENPQAYTNYNDIFISR